MSTINDVNICIATPNGSGSASANNILFKSIFKMGISCSSKNMFPSNIQSMPTWYEIRASSDGFGARKDVIDVMVVFNPETGASDVYKLRENGLLLYDTGACEPSWLERGDILKVGFPATELSKQIPNAKIRSKLRNMIYVGVIASLFGISKEVLIAVLRDTFGDKPEVIESNLMAIELGSNWVLENQITQNICQLVAIDGGNKGKILSDGNTCSALGAIYGGVSVVAWYPITPSSSLAETLEKYLPELRTDENDKPTYAIIQAEDEIAAAGIVTGAGWAGSRAMTATSGPGLSLMNEMVGLAYFTEIPSSYFIVQRGGPSTGLPTRTQQSDILSMYFASHGDTRHVVLLPYDLQTSFEFGKICLDLADQLQTPVFFASDLDLGMNIRPSDPLYLKDPVLNRGKLVHEKDIEAQGNQFRRYFDLDGDGIPQRTIPGNQHPKAVYFCSGAGHNADAKRSEDPGDYKELLDRLRKKNDTARLLVPQPVVALENQSRLGIISFGSSVEAVREARHRMALDGVLSSHLTLTALPLSPIVRDFVLRHEITLIVEQNRDGQVASILRMDWPDIATKVDSVLVYDGLPITAGSVHRLAMEKLGGKLL